MARWNNPPAAAPADGIGVPHLRTLWERTQRVRSGGAEVFDEQMWARDVVALRGLGVGLHESFEYLYQRAPAFAEFEAWIVERNGGAIDAKAAMRINAAINGAPVPLDGDAADGEVLSAADLAFWAEHGYVVVHDAVSSAHCAAAAAAICEYLGADLRDPSTWYARRNGRSIWVPMLDHPALWANRRSTRIRGAFAQLWGRRDLWVTVDQAGFNPPERAGWTFSGPHLHWDTELVPPVPFNVHGILYLTDTAANQGAFTCVPGFHRKLDAWLADLAAGADPQRQDLAALGPVPIAGCAGDLIVWRSALPHGASPNRSGRPRIVQYIQMQPGPNVA